MIDLELEWQKLVDVMFKHVDGKEFSGELSEEDASALREMIK